MAKHIHSYELYGTGKIELEIPASAIEVCARDAAVCTGEAALIVKTLNASLEKGESDD